LAAIPKQNRQSKPNFNNCFMDFSPELRLHAQAENPIPTLRGRAYADDGSRRKQKPEALQSSTCKAGAAKLFEPLKEIWKTTHILVIATLDLMHPLNYLKVPYQWRTDRR